MRSATVALLVLHYLVLLLTSATSAAAYLGLGSFLSQQYRTDPQAANDSFLSLTYSIKRSLSIPSIQNPPTPASLLSLQVSVPITVKLVGSTFSSSSPPLISSFLTSAISDDQYHVITPFSSSASHHLTLSHSLHLDVSVSSPSLSNQLSETLKAHLFNAQSSLRSPFTSVPYSLIDEIIKQDFEKDKPVDGIYVYILHLGSQSKNYAYSYTPVDSSPGVTKCMGSIWTGKDRYLWIDLGAGPVDYGPALSGDGVLPRSEFHPMAAMHGRPKSQRALLADLASLVWSAYQVLFVPSLRIPVPLENSLIVQFIHIYGSSPDNYGLDWKSIEKTFADEIKDKGLLLGDQKLSFKNYEVKLSDCSICSFAIWRATTSYTSRYFFDNYTLIVSEYLDSKRLHQTISESAEEFRRMAKVPEEDFSSRVLPVYVFDLDVSTILLLDRYHQSVAFKDMVIAARTESTQTVSDYSCNGRHVFTQTRELERPLVGSILQSMWGVSPTHLVWSPRHNSTLVDYTWSVGQTPFGPFSEISSMSFVQKDAARRNVLLTTFNYSIASAVDVLESIAAHGGEGKLLRKNQLTAFIQRWNLFKYKLDKAISSLSHFDFEMALYYLRSSDHDLYAIHSLVYHASQDLEASLSCFKDPPFPWGSVSISAGVLLSLIYVYSKREILFKNKRKQF